MFIQDVLQAIADYTGQSLELTAFFAGLAFVLVFFLLVLLALVKLHHASDTMLDVIVLFLGIAIVTFLEWWDPWIFLGLVFFALMAAIFFRNGMPALPSLRRG